MIIFKGKTLNVLSVFDGKYEVTTNGEVFSCVGKRKPLIGKITNSGYRMVLLTVDGKRLYVNVHRLIAKSFVDNPLNCPIVNHKDGNKLNNHSDNLEWCTHKYNQEHARDNGMLSSTTKIDMATANEIRDIRKTHGYTHHVLAEMFGIKKTQVGYILNNQRWVQ